jgi:hypothetical protein
MANVAQHDVGDDLQNIAVNHEQSSAQQSVDNGSQSNMVN